MSVRKISATILHTDEPEFVVEVVQHVTNVPFGNGEHPALKVAFMAISDHFAESATGKGDQFEYRITHPADGHQITVSVTNPSHHLTD